MKIVSFGDVHMATRNLGRMTEVLRDTDLIIVSGDLTNFGGIDDARKVLDDVRRACPHVLALPGNLDRREVTPFLEAEGFTLHGKGVVVGGIGIFGCGGSNITPFNTPTELTEDEIYETLRRGHAAVQDRRPLLMVCHTPPYETNCDRIVGGKAVGSTSARRFIEEVKPDLCISGHIHESAATDAIGPTTIINAGPFKGGGYIVIQVEGPRLEAKLEFL
ncbi:MAG: metallophosphoesterase [Deltaproteobacteria bacterium]|nr:metallophosphoesterase [Deltaproteobacteria bacterium]MBV8454679.1 metallophosphoesterase [Deltaproteobacteria bacterium]